METLHEMFFGDDGIFPSIGLDKTEIKNRVVHGFQDFFC